MSKVTIYIESDGTTTKWNASGNYLDIIGAIEAVKFELFILNKKNIIEKLEKEDKE